MKHKRCLQYKIYDSSLYSEEQARRLLNIPPQDIEERKLDILSRQNNDLRAQNEVYKHTILQRQETLCTTPNIRNL